MTDIIICGIGGNMGRMLYNAVVQSDEFKIVAGVDKYCGEKYGFPVYKDFDFAEKCHAVIDFSRPEALPQILNYCVKNGTPAVLATTGYGGEDYKLIEKASRDVAIFQSSNMSLGVNLLNQLVKKAAEFLPASFDIEIIEKHHNKKADSPSGTALTLANSINSVFEGKRKYVYGRHSANEKRQSGEIGIHAVRGGTVAGEHQVHFFGNDEIITLSHTALSKSIFAQGALKAAQFIKDKKRGLYTMYDMLG
jgi:4-hydroxy-tetrahydrodipicolinate reductase